jgi:putative transposase
MLAMFNALRSWRCFVDGRHYVVYTDHSPLQYLRTKKDPASRLILWLTDLELSDPIIKYKPGKDNVVPGALLR